MRASYHPDEMSRLRALRSYDVLDTPRERDFDDIVALAAEICQTPISVVNLIDRDRQWFKAEVGLGVRETPLETSICAHAILQKGIVEIFDTTLDCRFQDNPLVTGEPRLRFYAGALLETEEGLPIGTLCVLDTVPRTLTPVQRKTLEVLGRQVMTQLELRRNVRELEQANIDRRMAEKRSSEDRDFLRLVTDRLPVRVAYIDREFRYRFVNDAYERQLGLERDKVLGRTITEVLGEEMFLTGRPLIDRCFLGEAFSVDVELPYAPRLQWVHATYVPDFGPLGEVQGVVMHVLDITERREMEQALALERADQDRTLEIAQVGVWRLDVARNQVYGNKLIQTFFNVTEEDIQGGPLESYIASIHSDDRARVAAAIEASMGGGGRYEIEYRVTGSDGRERWLLAKGNADLGEDGKAYAFSGILLDATERINALGAMRESEIQRRRALDSAGIGAWNIDLASFKLTTDERFREIFGAKHDHLSYEEAFSQIHPEDRQRRTRYRLA
jgi:PAS domain S-box-containing protein